MKRIFSILICLILLPYVFPSSSLAGYSLSEMSEWEVIQIAAAANEEVMNRHQSESIELEDGQYTVGQNLPAEEYIIMLRSADISFTIYGTAGEQLLNLTLSAGENSSYVFNRVVLNNDNIVDITGSIVLVPYYGQDLSATNDADVDAAAITEDMARIIQPFFIKP